MPYTDSEPGYVDAAIPFSTRYIESQPGWADVEIPALRTVNLWKLVDGDRVPLFPRNPMSAGQWRSTLVPGEFFPDETNTGHYTPEGQLTVWDNPLNLSTAGATYEGIKFTNRVQIMASGITFRNCLFAPSSTVGTGFQVAQPSVSGTVLEDCTIRPKIPIGVSERANAVLCYGTTLRRCNIYGGTDAVGVLRYSTGPNAGRADVTIEGSWLHDLVLFSPNPDHADNVSHNDVIQWHGGKGLRVVGNRLEGYLDETLGDAVAPGVGSFPNAWVSGNPYPTSASTGRRRGISILMIAPGGGTHGELIFEKNWMNGGVVGINGGSSSNTSWLTDDGSTIVDNFIGLDWQHTETAGGGVPNSFAMLLRSTMTITIANNALWNLADNWDRSVPNNTRKNG